MPHLIAIILGLAAIMHTSAVAFQVLKYAGVVYLLYLAVEFIGLLEDAATRESVTGWQLAFLQDRVLTLSGKSQYYGAQFNIDK